MKVDVKQFKSTNDKSLIIKLWNVYMDSFESTKTKSAQDQICYKEGSFEDAVKDPEYEKFILFVDEEPVGLSMMTTNFEKARISYCDPAYYKARFPNWFAASRIYYVTILCILPNYQNQHFAYPLLQKMGVLFWDSKTMVCFDYSASIQFLPNLIIDASKRMGLDLIGSVLDQQIYHEVHFTRDNPN